MNNSNQEIGVLLAEGLSNHRQGVLDVAENFYRQVLAIDPNHPQALNLSAMVAYQRGDLERAVTLERQALDIAPDYAEAHNNLGIVLKAMGKLEEAASMLQRAIDLNATYTDAYNNLGNTYQEMDRFDEAVSCYHRALALRPDDPKIFNNMANTLQKQHQFTDAERYYRQALALNPSFAEALVNLGSVLQLQFRLDEAVATYLQATQVNPHLPDAYYNLGTALKDQQHTDDAIVAFEKTLALQPDHAGAQHLLNAQKGIATDVAPREYLIDLYNSFAETFDEHLVDKLDYCVPKILREDIIATASPQKNSWKVMDLGCGTGLSGEVLRDFAHYLIGVDLSPKMIEKAQKREIYDLLEVDDLVSALHKYEKDFDLVAAADVFIYLGDLTPVFEAAHHSLKKGGWFAFSVEKGGNTSYSLGKTGRYKHCPHSIKEIANDTGFHLHLEKEVEGRKERGQFVPQVIFVFETVYDSLS